MRFSLRCQERGPTLWDPKEPRRNFRIQEFQELLLLGSKGEPTQWFPENYFQNYICSYMANRFL
jgi:hypothetical protein